MFDKLNDIPGFHCLKPQGAFYLFPNVVEAAKKTGYNNVDEFTGALLEEAKVAVIPGSGFGSENNIRLSYATSLDSLEKAIGRMHEFVVNNSK